MRKTISTFLIKIRDILVVLYELTIFVIPAVLLYLAIKNIIGVLSMILCMFIYFLPSMFHMGMFGDKPKLFADKIMGYEDNLIKKVDEFREDAKDVSNRKE